MHPDREAGEHDGDDTVDERGQGRIVLVEEQTRTAAEAEEDRAPEDAHVTDVVRTLCAFALAYECVDGAENEHIPPGEDGDGGDGRGHVDLRVEPD